jgi:hypothetical protein
MHSFSAIKPLTAYSDTDGVLEAPDILILDEVCSLLGSLLDRNMRRGP